MRVHSRGNSQIGNNTYFKIWSIYSIFLFVIENYNVYDAFCRSQPLTLREMESKNRLHFKPTSELVNRNDHVGNLLTPVTRKKIHIYIS